MKTILKLLLLLGVVVYLVFAIVEMSRDDEERVCQGTRINIEQSEGQAFLDSQFVERLLAQANVETQGHLVRDIDVDRVELVLRSCPYVDSVLCYYTPEDMMCIRVIPRQPILHVMAEGGEAYYMDANGNAMPTTDFPLDLCLATGNITQDYAKEHLLELAQFFNGNERWRKDIQQIYVRDSSHIELVPTVQGHIIVLGEPTDIEGKMQRLATFYEECLNKAGWNKYSIINLNYADQVVCTKKKTK